MENGENFNLSFLYRLQCRYILFSKEMFNVYVVWNGDSVSEWCHISTRGL